MLKQTLDDNNTISGVEIYNILRVDGTRYFVVESTNATIFQSNDSFIENTTQTVLHVQENDFNLINSEFVQIVFCILYVTIFILGVFGNVLVCYVVLRNKAMQTVTNIFITNLALSDILLCILAVPFTPLYTFMGGWVFGRALCHLVPYAQGCSIYISTLTLTSIAIDRYLVIIYPFHPRMKLSICYTIILSIWIVSLLATLPYGMYVKVYSTYDKNGKENTYCEEDWPSEHYRKVFGSVTTILQFVLPFFIISICYTWVSIKLNARAKLKPGSKNSKKEIADRNRKKRTNRMLISMVLVFGVSWLPINVVNILNDFYASLNEWRFYTLLFFVAHFIAMSSTCYNPFLYAWLNENFCKEFKHVLPCFNQSPNNDIINDRRRSCRSERTYAVGGHNDDILHGVEDKTSKRDIIIAREPTYRSVYDKHISKKNDFNLCDDPVNEQRSTSVEIGCSETPFMSSSAKTGTSLFEITRTDTDNLTNYKNNQFMKSNIIT